MVTIRRAIRWGQAFAALLLLAVGPVVEPLRAEERALSQVVSGDPGKAIALKREQLGDTRPATQPERFDSDGDPDATLANVFEWPQLCAPPADLPRIVSTTRRSRRFCGASPRAPPSA
jgi:hypothetical protein